jgi:RNA polymerase sigma-70 factor (ECF subfamily)
MNQTDKEQNLNHISTLWTVVRDAHDGSAEAANLALATLVDRYSGAVRRYLLGALHDPHAADDLAQEFSLRMVRGDLRHADPRRGRFRDLVKTVLFHLIVDHQRKQRTAPQPLPADECGPGQADDTLLMSDEKFIDSWRQQLLAQAWIGLEKWDRQHGSCYFAVLRCRAENRELSSAELAEKLRKVLGKTVTADWVRQTLHRARDQFAQLLLDELSHSLADPTRELLAEELADLRLLAYCQDALQRWTVVS